IPPGLEGLKALGRAVVAGFPDVRTTIEDMLADGDQVVERVTARATHRGTFQGVAPTGREVTWTETHVYRLENGRIAEL
ncbi:ester cyclase, partial [Lacticaseibacillus paracasei]